MCYTFHDSLTATRAHRCGSLHVAGVDPMHLLARLHRHLVDITLDLIVPPWAVRAGHLKPPSGHHSWGRPGHTPTPRA